LEYLALLLTNFLVTVNVYLVTVGVFKLNGLYDYAQVRHLSPFAIIILVVSAMIPFQLSSYRNALSSATTAL